jgi:hypothetical protein
VTTNGSGSFTHTLVPPGWLAGTTLYLAMAHLTATSPEGFWISQTHRVLFTAPPLPGNTLPASGATTCNPNAVPMVLGDDDQANMYLNGGGFGFYGIVYTEVFVNSNGSMSFGAGDTEAFGSWNDFTIGPPRIAALWTDLDLPAGGTMDFYADLNGGFELCVNGVPGNPSLSPNSYRVSVTSSSIQIDYGLVTASNALVGVSPGGGGWVHPANLSLPAPGGTPIPFGHGLYESVGPMYGCNNSFDLGLRRVLVGLDPLGRPTFQN